MKIVWRRDLPSERKDNVKFEWDSRKARINLRKHGVTFEEAASVFDDPLASYYGDPDHSPAEQRYLAIGRSAKGRLIHCLRRSGGAN